MGPPRAPGRASEPALPFRYHRQRINVIDRQKTRRAAALKAWATRKRPQYRAARGERASKVALRAWCERNGWQVVFFEGRSGAPRTGIVDAVILRIRPRSADTIDMRFVQLKSGAAGLTAGEMSRLTKAVSAATGGWLLAAFDGHDLHFLPQPPSRSGSGD
jgi:hypothetical protein